MGLTAATGEGEGGVAIGLDPAHVSCWVWHIKVTHVMVLDSSSTPLFWSGMPPTGRNFHTGNSFSLWMCFIFAISHFALVGPNSILTGGKYVNFPFPKRRA